MGRGKIGLLMACTFASIGLLAGELQAGHEQSAKTIELTPQTIVSARRASMMLSGANMAAIKGAIDRGEDPKNIVFATTALAQWAKVLPEVFLVESTTSLSKAKPEIWSDRDAFSSISQSFATDTALLRDYAIAGKKESLAEQWTKVRSNCASCHERFKAD